MRLETEDNGAVADVPTPPDTPTEVSIRVGLGARDTGIEIYRFPTESGHHRLAPGQSTFC